MQQWSLDGTIASVWKWSLDGECVQLQITLDGKKKTSTYPTRRERPLIKKTGWGTTEREGDSWTERGREAGRQAGRGREGGREGGCSAL